MVTGSLFFALYSIEQQDQKPLMIAWVPRELLCYSCIFLGSMISCMCFYSQPQLPPLFSSLRMIQHTAVSWNAKRTFSCNFFTACQLPLFMQQSCDSSTLTTSDVCRASFRLCIHEQQEWKEGSRGGRAPLLEAKSCYASLVRCWIISLGHHNYRFLHGVIPSAVRFDCSIAPLVAWLLSKDNSA